jgi:hypothetical protein
VPSISSGRLGYLLRWLGLTLVVLLVLQLLAVITIWNWQEEGFRQLVVERLVTQSPLALVGLLLILLGARLDHPSEHRTPLRWLVAILAGILAIALAVAVPVSISGDGVLSAQTQQSLAAKRSQLEMARQQSENPEVLNQLVRQAEQSGQIPPQATQEQKLQAARGFIDRQLKHMEQQFKQEERASDLASRQRLYAGTGAAVVLAVAFTLVALAAVL